MKTDCPLVRCSTVYTEFDTARHIFNRILSQINKLFLIVTLRQTGKPIEMKSFENSFYWSEAIME
jgi:hypothetical protein